MKKLLIVVLILSLTLTACLPALLQNGSQAPQIDIQATAAASGATIAAQTLESLPTPTIPSNTPVIANSPTSTADTSTSIAGIIGVTETLSVTGSVIPSQTGTLPTGTVANTTSITPTGTNTVVSGFATPTQTLHPRYYGTLPPKVPFGFVLVINKAKAEAYISLQCTRSDGDVTIIEFPVKGSYGVDAPSGHYLYVAWVGGNKMVGQFSLDNGEDLTIILYKDRITLK